MVHGGPVAAASCFPTWQSYPGAVNHLPIGIRSIGAYVHEVDKSLAATSKFMVHGGLKGNDRCGGYMRRQYPPSRYLAQEVRRMKIIN